MAVQLARKQGKLRFCMLPDECDAGGEGVELQ